MRDEDQSDEVVRTGPGLRTLGIVAVLLFLAGAGSGWGASRVLEPTTPVEAPAAEGMVSELPQTDVVSLGEFTVNLRGGGGGRVLRTEIQVEGNPLGTTRCSERMAQVRDAILTVVSDYTYAEVEGVGGKMRLRDEILTRVNGVLAPERVDRVYFITFVVH